MLEYLLMRAPLREQCTTLRDDPCRHVDDEHNASHLRILGTIHQPELDRFFPPFVRLESYTLDDGTAGRLSRHLQRPVHFVTQPRRQCVDEPAPLASPSATEAS